MKKWMIGILMITLAAGIAFAEDGRPWWKFGFGKKGEVEEQPAPPREGMQRHRPGMMQRGERSPMTEEQRAKIEEAKAHREVIQKLADAARAETDPVKKEELVSQLRAKLTEGAKKMHEQFQARLQKAEAEVAKQKERLADAEQNMDARVEEHLQKLLAGEKPPRHGPAGHPGGASHKKSPPPPAE